ncbi:MAG: M1 family metallopeptidase [Bacteroidota bacterium]
MKNFIHAGILFFAVSCSSTSKEEKKIPMRTDIHSYALPDEAVIKHLDIDLNVNFDKKQLSGTAILTIDNISKGSSLHLDARDLTIEKITLDDGASTTFEMKKAEPYLGSELVVAIKPETKKVTINYSTSPDAAALQWLTPAQTAGGKFPFLFTQSQAILARTWIPLQDSPGIRFTYTATIHCPKELMAVMSADNDTVKNAEGVYHFEMPQAIPSYLMALTVGDLQFHSYDKRSGVFAEPVTLAKAAYEFEDMPKMISTAEELYGPYAWGRYDVLVLPPSFPFGGMENPRITFATPTILAGDRSLVSLIAHELAHSWSGNLVTNATWNDFWLNEGFTVYFETRIMEKLYGKPYADMLTVLSKGELLHTIDVMGKDNADTKLFLDLKGRDPDEGVSDIAYEKGRFFLTTIEKEVGRERWDAFVKKYFHEHAFQSITTEKFLAYLDKELIKGNADLKNKLRVNDWVYGPGLPDNCVEVTSDELAKATGEADAFINGKKPSELNTKDFTTHHWLQFLRQLPDSLPAEKLAMLDKQFHFTQSGNAEIKCEWLQLVVHSNYEPAYAALEEFLTSVGRRKFLKPLYIAMAATPSGKIMAKNIYAKARSGYHAVAYNTIDEILK